MLENHFLPAHDKIFRKVLQVRISSICLGDTLLIDIFSLTLFSTLGLKFCVPVRLIFFVITVYLFYNCTEYRKDWYSDSYIFGRPKKNLVNSLAIRMKILLWTMLERVYWVYKLFTEKNHTKMSSLLMWQRKHCGKKLIWYLKVLLY